MEVQEYIHSCTHGTTEYSVLRDDRMMMCRSTHCTTIGMIWDDAVVSGGGPSTHYHCTTVGPPTTTYHY